MMLDGLADRDTLTIQRVWELGARGDVAEVTRLLSTIPASRRIGDPVAMTLRALKMSWSNDVPGAIAMFRRALLGADSETAAYIADLVSPYLIGAANFAEARELVSYTSAAQSPAIQAASLALRSLLAAQGGDDVESRELAAKALAITIVMSEDPVIIARLKHRLGVAAYYRNDFMVAEELALEAARAYEAGGADWQASKCYSLLHTVANDWLGNPDLARYYAQRYTMLAHKCGDIALENSGLIAQLEIAAETGDFRRTASLRRRLLANRSSEQYHERFAFAVAEVLVDGVEGRYESASALLGIIRSSTTRSLPERALCDALAAALAFARGRIDEARRLSRLAISESAHRSGAEPQFEARRRLTARLFAAAVCFVVGDPSRARRALTRAYDPDGSFVKLLTPDGVDEVHAPTYFRGYARLINASRLAFRQHEPPLELTPAEMQVLVALPDGTTVAALADTFGKSRKTVEAQLSSIYRKLDVTNRAQAIRRGREIGILT